MRCVEFRELSNEMSDSRCLYALEPQVGCYGKLFKLTLA